MQVTQTKAEGLSREFAVTVPATELQTKLAERIEEIRPQMNLKGFRPGKVPAAHVRKMFGKDLMGEVVDKLVNETNQKALEDNELRPAGQPSVKMDSDIEAVLNGDADLSYNMNVDVMPEFEPADVTKLKIERPVSDIPDEEVEEALGKIAEQNIQYEPARQNSESERR